MSADQINSTKVESGVRSPASEQSIKRLEDKVDRIEQMLIRIEAKVN